MSDALADLTLQTVALERLVMLHPWGVSVPEGTAAFYVVVEGSGQLTMDRCDIGTPFGPGDLIVLTRPIAHRLQSVPESPVIPLQEMLLGKSCPALVESERHTNLTRLVTCQFAFPRRCSGLLPLAMPPCLLVPATEWRVPPWLEDSIRLMLFETRSARPGGKSILDRLAQVVVIEAVRDYLARLPSNGEPWLRALLDPSIGMALGLMHRFPEKPWTVASLAGEVAMSRSAFADRFTSLVGTSPAQYLTERRMQTACRLLRDPNTSIAEVASRVGYQSAAAFNNAFRRWAGIAPGLYRRGHSALEGA